MIFGNTNHLQDFGVLQNPIKECFAYLQSHNMLLYEKGSYPIDGDRLFVNIMEYRTTVPEERFWEAHKEYLDVHVALQGREQIDLGFIWKMQQGEYVEKDDFLPLEGEKNGSVILEPGDFLVCCPYDGHRTAVAAGQPEDIRKAIFKVRIEKACE